MLLGRGSPQQAVGGSATDTKQESRQSHCAQQLRREANHDHRRDPAHDPGPRPLLPVAQPTAASDPVGRQPDRATHPLRRVRSPALPSSSYRRRRSGSLHQPSLRASDTADRTHCISDLRFNLSPGPALLAHKRVEDVETCAKENFYSMFNINPSVYGTMKSRRRRRMRSRKNVSSAPPPSTRERVECTEEDEEPPLCYHRWCEDTPGITMGQVLSLLGGLQI